MWIYNKESQDQITLDKYKNKEPLKKEPKRNLNFIIRNVS